MARYLWVLDNGEPVRCKLVESLGFNPDIGKRVSVVLHEGAECKAVYVGPKQWRFWTPRDRVQPFVEDLERRARERALRSQP